MLLNAQLRIRTVAIDPIDPFQMCFPLIERFIKEPLAAARSSFLLIIDGLLVRWMQPRTEVDNDYV